MTSYIQSVVDFVAAHPHWAGLAVFLVSMGESLAVIGLFIPGTTILIGVGAVIAVGALPLWPLLLWTMAGAVVGDGLSYWVGRRYHQAIRGRWPFRRRPQLMASGEEFFRRHGGKSVFLGRFFGPVRAIIPLVAGMLDMPARRFLLFNLLSALLWAPAYILPGVLLGASLSLAGAVTARLAVLIVLIAAVLWLTFLLLRWLRRRGPAHFAALLEWLGRWAGRRRDWVGRMVLSLLDPQQPEAKALALGGAVLIAAGMTFGAILEDVATGDPLIRADSAVYHALQGLRSPWGDAVVIAVTELGDAVVLTPLVVVAMLWLASRRAWRAAIYLAVAAAVSSLFVQAMKLVLHRPRPLPLYAGSDAFSFPSGHATSNLVVYGFIAVLLAREARPLARRFFVLLPAAIVALVAFSRLYLGAHWLSDVLGGLSFAAAWLALLSLAYLRHDPVPVRAGPLATLLAAALVAVGGWHIGASHAADVARYAVRVDVRSMTLAAYETDGWQALPARRVDLGGEIEEPLTLQWAGDIDDLRARLLAAGWRAPAEWTLSAALAWLAPAPRLVDLPVLPRLNDGLAPAMTLVATAADAPGEARLVLRLWASPVRVTIANATVPVWVGNVVEERLRRTMWLTALVGSDADMNRPRDLVAAALAPARLLPRKAAADATWDGRVLLAAASSVAPP